MSMTVAFGAVAMMLLYALPGFLMIRTGLVSHESISAFAKLLMYVCQPVLVVYSFLQVSFSPAMVRDMLIVLVFILAIQCAVLLAVYAVLRRKAAQDVKYRVYAFASSIGNYAFMGIPILEALLPAYPQVIAFSVMASLALNIVSWTIGSAIISGDRRYISIRRLVLNPTTLSLVVAVPLFVLQVQLPAQLDTMVTLLARMTTPLCMIIMGMRLATSSLKEVFCQPGRYVIVVIKQMLVPALAWLLLLLLPLLDYSVKASIYILLCCPIASMVLNFAEMLGKGQKTAADLVLLGTLLSTLTIPLMAAVIG